LSPAKKSQAFFEKYFNYFLFLLFFKNGYSKAGGSGKIFLRRRRKASLAALVHLFGVGVKKLAGGGWHN
jgi:hypothetical protein